MKTDRNYKYPDFVDSAKIDSKCFDYSKEKFRFYLEIPFKSKGKNFAVTVMKNPSDADTDRCDMTVIKLTKAVHCAGYDGVIILNLFPYRSKNAKNVFSEYYKDKELYSETMQKNYELIEKVCQNRTVLFGWGTNTISKTKDFRFEYETVAEKVIDIVRSVAKEAMSFQIKGRYPLHPLRWWETIISESEETLESKSPTVHRNFFGMEAVVESAVTKDTFEIYCRYENKVCVPRKCDNCAYYAGDDMGNGRVCEWFDDDFDGGEHIVQHEERFAEYDRANNCGDFDFAVGVFLAMTPEQAQEEGRLEIVSPSFPQSSEIYFKLRDIPEKFCVSKSVDWQTEIRAKKENFKEIMRYLYTEKPSFDFEEYLDEIKGDEFIIVGFGD